MAEDPGSSLSRRRFLAVSAGVGAGVASAVSGLGSVGTVLAAVAPASSGSGGPSDAAALAPGLVPFEGADQGGILRPATSQPATIVAAFDVTAADRDELVRLFAEITARSRALATARPPDPLDPAFPPPESGILGSSIGPSDLTVTVSVGASLFDERYSLADRKPRQLTEMPVYVGDQLERGASHGDLLVQVCATDELACIHAMRYLMAGTRALMALRWMITGFQRSDVQPGEGRTSTRNLLGFKDGTANPTASELEAGRLLWVGDGDGEPAWATGGSYVVVRRIRMFVERWDRTALSEQEAVIGRTKRTGAPIGSGREEDVPDYAADPAGVGVPLDSHIRLANPRTAATERNRILRRGYSYNGGFDPAGQLDQGLLFVAYQRDLEAGFVTVQQRLIGEPLAEYIRTEGGGFFFTLPGVTSRDGILGGALLA
ncbi:MAG: iron uptake transporter deferrochelatase/peroxidase subunit [Chloroflexota bacterium]